MKGKLFLLALVAALSFSTVQAQVKMENAVKTGKFSHQVTKQALNARYLNVPTLNARADVPAGYALVTLSAGDIWNDGSGYQMLLDADANAYGTIIPETGALTTGGDVPAYIYDEFEYKIPENADGALTTGNIVFDEEVSILVPAGVYDYCITNPTPGDRMWISSSNGPIPGRGDNFEFMDGMTYIFTIGIYGSNDGVDLKVLEPGVSLTVPENLAVDPAATTANVSWEDNDDILWNLRYRVNNPNEGGFWDFEDDSQLEGWMIYDYDGDGNNWYYTTSDMANSGEYVLGSDSYNWGALSPDNWLISPEVMINGELSFYATGAASSWYDEVFRVYVGPADWTSVDEFVPVSEDMVTNYGMTQYTFDLSGCEFAGQKAVFAIRHYNCSDVYSLYIDDVKIGEPGYEWITVEGIDDLSAVLEGLTPETTYEVQVQATGTAGFSSEWSETVLFTTLSDDVPPVYEETCAAPNGEYIIIDKEKALVTITNNEPGATVHYVVTLDGVVMEEGDFTGDTWEYIAVGPGAWLVSCVASLPGKNDSNPGGVFFPIAPGQQPVAVDEMMAGKTISSVRYYNAAGQEMQEANGLTIVVTTYTDGTTNAVKVVK